MLDSFSNASKAFGLTISLSKTEVLLQPEPNTNPLEPVSTTDNKQLLNMKHFKYLGSIIPKDGSLDKEIASRISKASQALGRLRTRVLNEHNICLSNKLKVCSMHESHGSSTAGTSRSLRLPHVFPLLHPRNPMAGPNQQP